MTITDREVFELAAKAAGYTKTAWVEDANGVDRFQVYSDREMWLEWNPRDDDGDALRLATSLRMEIDHNHSADQVLWVSVRAAGQRLCAVEEFDREEQRIFATRRTIFRAAAGGVGTAMPCAKS